MFVPPLFNSNSFQQACAHMGFFFWFFFRCVKNTLNIHRNVSAYFFGFDINRTEKPTGWGHTSVKYYICDNLPSVSSAIRQSNIFGTMKFTNRIWYHNPWKHSNGRPVHVSKQRFIHAKNVTICEFCHITFTDVSPIKEVPEGGQRRSIYWWVTRSWLDRFVRHAEFQFPLPPSCITLKKNVGSIWLDFSSRTPTVEY